MDTEFTVFDAMTKDPVIISPEKTIQESAQIMQKHNIGSILVMKDEELAGIITEYDIVRKVTAQGKDSKTTLVKEVMCNDVTTINPSAKLFDAISMMTQLDIRHLPVVHNKEFMGFLTAKDVLKIEPALFEILIDSVDLREEDRKPIYRDNAIFPDEEE